MTETGTVAPPGAADEAQGGRRPPGRARTILGGLAGGLVAMVIGVVLWVGLNQGIGDAMRWFGVVVGVIIAGGVWLGAGTRTRVSGPVIVVVLTIAGSFLADNFHQRAQLQDGIAQLQAQWGDLHVVLPEAPTAPASDGAATSGTTPPSACPANPDLVPPPQIVKVLPVEAFACMKPELLATVWPDVPEEMKPQIPGPLRDAALAIIGQAEASAARNELADAQARFSATTYDIPAPVLACAPPPDLTQPTAQAGLGFPDGVPLILPLADVLNEPLARGDGADYGQPSPFCFARESAKDNPLTVASWGLGAVLGALLVFRRRPRPLPSGA